MQLRVDNKEIKYSGEDIVNVLKEIEYILQSLHHQGSYYADDFEQKKNEYEKETCAFIDNSLVSDRLSKIRMKLTSGFNLEPGDDEMDDLEREFENLEHWHKPGDYSKEFWL